MSFLRNLFGPSRDEIWQQFAAAVGGNFTAGGFWNGGKVEARVLPFVPDVDGIRFGEKAGPR